MHPILTTAGATYLSAGLPLRHLRFPLLAGCEQNTYVAPPPPKVKVATPVQRPITRYLEATGNTAAVKQVDLVARVPGFVAEINYQDGALVKKGTTLFTIEPETYKVKLEQAQAAEAGAQATVKQAEADFKRQAELVAKQAVSQATLDTAPRPATPRRPICSRRRPTPGSPNSTTTTPR